MGQTLKPLTWILPLGLVAACSSTPYRQQPQSGLPTPPTPTVEPAVSEEPAPAIQGYADEQITIDKKLDDAFQLEMNDDVRRWKEYFTGKGRGWYQRALDRSAAYMPIMRKILKEHGLPADLVFMAFIESGFSNKAYSRAHAVGP